MKLSKLLLAGLLLTGCASTSPKDAFSDVAGAVEARSGKTVRWDQGGDDDKKIEEAVDRLLAQPLTADSAVQIALLTNPALRAKLEELSIAQADLVQAGLLKNPVFSVGRTAWESEHINPNLFATVEQDFLDILTMPLRKRVARSQLEATKLEVGDEVLELAAHVREAYYTAQAAKQVAAMRQLVEEAATTTAELAQHQHAAGNMNDLNLQTQLGQSAQAALDRKRADGEAAVAREQLNKAMGLWGRRTGWSLPTRLPELPKEEPPLGRLELVAMRERLDIAAGNRNVEAMKHALSLAKATRWTGTVNVAVETGRLRHNRRFSFGPSVGIEIPLFDQRQAQIAKLEAHTRQAENELNALAIDVRADVRSAHARVITARNVVLDYTKVVVPTRERILKFSQEQYDAMLLGVYQLIQAKQSEYDAYREAIEALRDYWIARSDLERAVGTRVGTAAVPAPPPAKTVAPPPAHHH